MPSSFPLRIYFSGGTELLFGGIKSTHIDFPFTLGKATLKDLLPWLRDNLLKERPELFMDGNTIRPGILILINDVDWELEGQLDYLLRENDEIVFISTLHGG
ncbi:Ubiquitin- modifier 1 [Coelomomyces lativittatus]|nr:Ubiquitin- modifier 1 [Coelomomyces lativittatus]KAJ1507297.1 Ubiquitin- modifier 1 [Coelomomyces lativittatus]KAJ1509408.1 Ubiquitin- modifier 1 [Coelomomyces lativittatus]